MFGEPTVYPLRIVSLRLQSVGSSTDRLDVPRHSGAGERSKMSKNSFVSIVISVVLAVAAGSGKAYTYDASDCAVEVVEYVEGTGVGSDFISGDPFNNSSCSLGRPTVDTTGDGWFIPLSGPVPVVAVYSPFRASEVVAIGDGGQLTVKFDHKVLDESLNPYGLDFTIFGNASQSYDWENDPAWSNGDPNDFVVTGGGYSEPGIVSVSQDGLTWYEFTNGPFADDFAPTLGRVYDEQNPDESIGEWNNWWGEPTDPTIPLDPSLGFASFDGWTIAQIGQLYGESAGGMGFDISGFDLAIDPQTGCKWIQYIRVADNGSSSAITEIDAFADVAAAPEPATLMVLMLGGWAVLRANRRQ
jgi:hypothetical protein